MEIQIYNSLGNKKQVLKPLRDKVINMYSCGVTVYDRCHIGHARSLYIFDVIRRYLQYRGYDVFFIRNITDIDDKIINRAKELKKDWRSVVDENIKAYQKDLKLLGILSADEEPRATEHIPEIISHIQGLIDKGYAYPQDGDVYFSVRQFKGYGKLSGQSIEKMQEAVRIEKDDKKKDPLDFALWKKSKDGEPFWDSPWGPGRPGWHIECSAMSMKCAGVPTLDIHAGGRDLIFPHHENEVAQSEALTGKPFANYWIHHGLLTINGQKMSKSLGNFITIEDALKKYSVNQLKMLFLSSHYASPVDFTDEKMSDMKKSYEKISILMLKLNALNKATGGECPKFVSEMRKKFLDSMDDDFNTPKALAVLFDLIHWCNNELMESNAEHKHFMLRCAMDFIKEVTDIFGLSFSNNLSEADFIEEIQELLKERTEARLKKDFKRSDEIRDLLKQKGVIIEDGKEGQTWRRV